MAFATTTPRPRLFFVIVIVVVVQAAAHDAERSRRLEAVLLFISQHQETALEDVRDLFDLLWRDCETRSDTDCIIAGREDDESPLPGQSDDPASVSRIYHAEADKKALSSR